MTYDVKEIIDLRKRARLNQGACAKAGDYPASLWGYFEKHGRFPTQEEMKAAIQRAYHTEKKELGELFGASPTTPQDGPGQTQQGGDAPAEDQTQDAA